MVEKIKAGWISWVFQGIPASAVVLGAVLSFGRVIGTYDQRIKTLEDDRVSTARQMQTLIDSNIEIKLQIQRLEDKLENSGDISYVPHIKKGINYQISDGR